MIIYEPTVERPAQEADLAEARLRVSELEAKQHADRKAKLVRQLEAVSVEERMAQRRYAFLSAQIKRRRAAVVEAQERCNNAQMAISESMQQRPAVADWLAGDPDVVAWQERHTALEQKHAALVAARVALPNPDEHFNECIQFEGSFGKLAQLAYSKANLINALEGKGAGSRNRVTGGVSGVT